LLVSRGRCGEPPHLDRLHAELQFLPCSPRCANWLCYGVQPDHPGPGLILGQCRQKVHDRENLGLGRRVLSSRLWSGKSVAQHKADRAEVVRQTLLLAGIDAPDLDGMAATVTMPDRSPLVWTDTRPDHDTYVKIILTSIGERQCWRAQFRARQDHRRRDGWACGQCFDSCSTAVTARPSPRRPQLGLTR
jgi:hypothetical protein